jgi:hypothetical protein
VDRPHKAFLDDCLVRAARNVGVSLGLKPISAKIRRGIATKRREALKHVFPATGGALHSARPAQAQFGACNCVQIIRLERRDALVCSRFPCMSPFQMHYPFRNRKR